MQNVARFEVANQLSHQVRDLVLRIFDDCPGQSEYRYVSRLDELDFGDVAKIFRERYAGCAALHVTNLPQFESVQQSKILALLLGDAIGKCVAYSDYNQSYITDIRPTNFSREASSGSTLLRPHSDLAFADPDSRPRDLVLVPHKAEGDQVKTLITPANLLDAELSPEDKAILREPIFEVVSGMKLAWKHLRITRLALLSDVGDRVHIRYDLSGLTPARDLDESKKVMATRAIASLEEIALKLGREYGIAVSKGESLFIANDLCLHGRAELDPARSQRLLLRAYVVGESVVKAHHNRMISLGH